MARMPTYFISHGGGPWPWIPEMREAFAPLEESFLRMPGELPERPKAVLMISGHWEETDAYVVMHGANPPMLYDYHGFPPHTYDITYPAPGDPGLAERVAGLIEAAGLPTRLDDERGYDHGTFVPMAVTWPDADMPLVQLSMRSHYAPAEHLELGRALATLRDEGVLIVGSGLSYHNLRAFGPAAREPSEAFDLWLTETLSLPPDQRTARLMEWEKAPHARECHAREDHLVPLFTALGAAEGETATRTYHQKMILGGVTASSWRFG
ncbi:dioxygenase family protein [Aquicoccus porphyridii]|uniref:Dioxygenase n=1 Tax=Aquicoccus porphyridii TaxID=1852029 RepID=A0A5A9ZKI6_9RHOB|nr:class III extradiol ring-cleavage dioxygenase [Aquicoccus porphyridii]KAA0917569.1 dioxygenase [Aquicoccus porphyridii]RAI55647.1 dioxygenase [Rhodobacteraceae bacterium AsT-22]